MQIRIYYEDTDSGGIVYHTNYIKYCERARSEQLLFAKGFNPDKEEDAFVVKSLRANFLGFARLGDKIEVRTEVIKVKPITVILKQEIYKILDSSSQILCDDKIFELEVKLGHINIATGKPTMIPKLLLRVLNAQ